MLCDWSDQTHTQVLITDGGLDLFLSVMKCRLRMIRAETWTRMRAGKDVEAGKLGLWSWQGATGPLVTDGMAVLKRSKVGFSGSGNSTPGQYPQRGQNLKERSVC